MEANELFEEIEKHLVEVKRLVDENKDLIKPEHRFGLYYNCIFQRTDEQYATHISTKEGMPEVVVAAVAVDMTDNLEVADVMLRSVYVAFKTALEKPEVAASIRNESRKEH